MILAKFMVVDIPSIYNIIIGQSTLNKLRVMVSTYHKTMKYSIKENLEHIALKQ